MTQDAVFHNYIHNTVIRPQDKAVHAVALAAGITCFKLGVGVLGGGWVGTGIGLGSLFFAIARDYSTDKRDESQLLRYAKLRTLYTKMCGVKNTLPLQEDKTVVAANTATSLQFHPRFVSRLAPQEMAGVLGHEIAHSVYGRRTGAFLRILTTTTALATVFAAANAATSSIGLPPFMPEGSLLPTFAALCGTHLVSSAHSRHVERVCDRVGVALTGSNYFTPNLIESFNLVSRMAWREKRSRQSLVGRLVPPVAVLFSGLRRAVGDETPAGKVVNLFCSHPSIPARQRAAGQHLRTMPEKLGRSLRHTIRTTVSP